MVNRWLRVFTQSPDGYLHANVAGMTTAFKRDILLGLHAFGASVIRAGTTKDTFNAALFLVSGSRGVADTVYSTTGELAGTGGYTQGGVALTNGTDPATSGTAAIWTPTASASWTSFTSSGAFDACVIYNATSSSKLEVGVFTFGSQTVTAGTFTLTMPANTVGNALVQIS